MKLAWGAASVLSEAKGPNNEQYDSKRNHGCYLKARGAAAINCEFGFPGVRPFISRCLISGLLSIFLFSGFDRRDDNNRLLQMDRQTDDDTDSLGPHQVLVFEGRTLQVDDSLGPQRDMKDPPHLDVHLGRTKDHHVVVLDTHTYNLCCD